LKLKGKINARRAIIKTKRVHERYTFVNCRMGESILLGGGGGSVVDQKLFFLIRIQRYHLFRILIQTWIPHAVKKAFRRPT
jgi:hypothetical protein